MKTNRSAAAPEWGFFALVTYIPDPLGSFLRALRHELPGDENPEAHITLLPPRALTASVDLISSEAQAILSRFQPFRVKLSSVASFPESNILYLNVSDGSELLHQLHDALNTASLAHEENFDFLPHLTISGPIPQRDLAKVKAQAERSWNAYQGNTSFEINEVSALWQPRYTSPDDWNRLWSQRLADTGSSARAGKS